MAPLDALLDGQRDLVGLAVADADLRLLVAHDDERGEREAPAALDDLGDAVDLDDPLLEVGAAAGVDCARRLRAIGSHTRVAELASLRSEPPSRAPSASALTRPW